LKCPYYLGIEKKGKDSGIRCTKGFLLLMSDEGIQQNLDIKCVGDAKRDHCRPFLFRRCEELGLNPSSEIDTENDLRNMYLKKIGESGTMPPKEENSVSEKCGSCDIGHWYSGYNTYTNVVQEDGIHTVKRPCEPHTHYCYQFEDGQRKIAVSGNFDPGIAPDWCPLQHDKFQNSAEEPEEQDDENTGLQSTAKETEEKPMESVMMEPAENNSAYQQAIMLTRRIRVNASVAAGAIVSFCKDLAQMRDDKLYIQLGYETFEAYTKKEFDIEQRQAYTYISVYEKYGDTFLQSNSNLGITKLALLAEVSDAERSDFMENNDIAGMSVREIKAMADKLKDTGEQLSMLTSERDNAKTAADNSKKLSEEFADELDTVKRDKEAAENARAEAARQLKEAQDRIAALEKAEPDATTLEKLKAEADKKAKKEYKDKLQAEKDKVTADALKQAEEKIKAAREEGEKAGAERVKNSLEAVEQEKAAALTQAAELEKKLKVASNQDTALFNFLFDAWQQDFNKMCGLIKKVNESDSDFAGKMSGAVKAAFEQQKSKLM
jgi:hypothetical protein